MQRYPGIDPPEYVDWRPEPSLLDAFRARIDEDPERASLIRDLGEDARLDLYRGMLRFRLHDYALKRWVKRGVISKAWLGTGEEAVTVGCVHALERDHDIVAPMIRNAGACHEMGMPLVQLFAAYLGTTDAPSRGRDLHVGDTASGVLPPISPVGDMVPVITGVALAFRRRGEPRVALTWIGDGATKTTPVHEGLNLAAVLRVPAVFVLQNNQVALGTRLDQHQPHGFDAWHEMYGMTGMVADGNHVLDVWAATRLAARRAREGGGPTLLRVETFRMGGHATHDEAEARRTFDARLFDNWGRRDPIGLFEEYLIAEGTPRKSLMSIEQDVIDEIDSAAQRALEGRDSRMPPPVEAELPGFSAGVRQPALTRRLEQFSAP